MKLENKNTDFQGIDFGLESMDSEISTKKMFKMWDMYQNPYKNNIGSIVREITSNCFDAHAEIGVTDAVRIKFGRDDSGAYISFIDVGVGISPTRMKDVYRNYLESTKEDSNDFIGAFGRLMPN